MSVNYYANGRLAVLSSKLMTADKFNRLAECNAIAEAVKVLSECGYESMISSGQYQQVLSAELDDLLSLFVSLSTDIHVTEYIMSRYNYHNAKVLAKCKYRRIEGLKYCYAVATIDIQLMQEYINSDNYSLLPDTMAKALESIDIMHSEGKDNPQAIDIALDKAMFANMLICASKSNYSVLTKLIKLDIDTVNILMLFRLRALGLSPQEYNNIIVDGGDLDRQWLSDSYIADNDKIIFDMYYHSFRKLIEICIAGNGNLSNADNYVSVLKTNLIEESNNVDTISPLLVYYYNKVAEIDKIRYIMMCIKSNLDKDTTLARIKEIYGGK